MTKQRVKLFLHFKDAKDWEHSFEWIHSYPPPSLYRFRKKLTCANQLLSEVHPSEWMPITSDFRRIYIKYERLTDNFFNEHWHYEQEL